MRPPYSVLGRAHWQQQRPARLLFVPVRRLVLSQPPDVTHSLSRRCVVRGYPRESRKGVGQWGSRYGTYVLVLVWV